MRFEIYYREPENILYDIYMDLEPEMFQCGNLWWIDLNVNASISNAVGFLGFVLPKSGQEGIQKFKENCKKIENLDDLLWEKYDNSHRYYDEAERDFNDFRTIVEDIVNEFADKYGLGVEIIEEDEEDEWED